MTRNYFLFTVIYCITVGWCQASCPNHCNNKGVCDKFSRCTCANGFQGADCSERICPFGLAWSDEAIGVDLAHQKAECSNRGICNRKSGKCECMEGFTGTSCERLSCSVDCHGKGVCSSMRDFAASNLNDLSQSFEYSLVWDADKIKGCECDEGLTGYDCGLSECPVGDDPLTKGQVNEVQLLKCTATQGTFVLFYNGKPSASIAWNANSVAVADALLAIPELTGVKVSFSQVHGTVCQIHTNVVSVEFTSQFGPQNPLVPVLDATLSGNGGSVVVSGDGETAFTDVSGKSLLSVKGTKESDSCSNRGLCNTYEGSCGCYDTNGDRYDSSDGYAAAGTRGDCGFVASSTSSSGVTTCPGDIQCSGHGICDQSTFRCSCSAGWESGDCSEKSCPLGKSWYGYPSADNQAHDQYETCSNMGICDHTTGSCVCRKGFYGEACEYMSCGGGVNNPCSGHGRCMSMAELALWANDNGDATAFEYGSDPNNPLTWDSDRVHGCHCDLGYSGYDCSQVDCPAGDDPGTYLDHVEVQLLQCIADAGNFTLSFRQAVTPPLPHDITAQALREALIALPTIYNINVYFTQDGEVPPGVLDYVLPLHSDAAGTPSWAQFFPNSPTPAPSPSPSVSPQSSQPSYSMQPSSAVPSPGAGDPSVQPSLDPSVTPTEIPSVSPSVTPSLSPSVHPSACPSISPSIRPSLSPTALSGAPTARPTEYHTTPLCRIDGNQIAIIEFQFTHGDLPSLLVNNYNLGDFTHHNGEPNTGAFSVFTDGQQISSMTSIKGTTEVDVCNNRGLCDTSTGLCECFPTWTSSDGGRQGKAGNTRDCGYRNDHLYTQF